MNVKITPTKLHGTIDAPPSKSYAHRLIISAFLSKKSVRINNVGYSDDINATVNALNTLGGNITICENYAIVNPPRLITEKVKVDCGESGSTLRFLMPIAAALGINAEFTGHGRLLERPIGDLLDALKSHGVSVCGYTVSGKLTSGEYVINAGVSSQYITGLLFALSILDGDSSLILQGNAVSRGYIDITVDVLKLFGVQIQKNETGYFIKGNQTFNAPSKIDVEGDYSGAAFVLSLGALGGEITVKGLNKNSLQGDAKIIDALKRFGANVTENGGLFTVKSGKLNAIELDCDDIPDIVQIISVVASYANGTTVLKNVDRLRIKESDRVEAVIKTLKTAGITAWYNCGNLYINGGKPTGGVFDGGKDHRTVMSAAVLSAYADGKSTIIGAEASKKSYPAFFDDLKSLGGNIDVEI